MKNINLVYNAKIKNVFMIYVNSAKYLDMSLFVNYGGRVHIKKKKTKLDLNSATYID